MKRLGLGFIIWNSQRINKKLPFKKDNNTRWQLYLILRMFRTSMGKRRCLEALRVWPEDKDLLLSVFRAGISLRMVQFRLTRHGPATSKVEVGVLSEFIYLSEKPCGIERSSRFYFSTSEGVESATKFHWKDLKEFFNSLWIILWRIWCHEHPIAEGTFVYYCRHCVGRYFECDSQDFMSLVKSLTKLGR